MQHGSRWRAAALLLVASLSLAAAACSGTEGSGEGEGPGDAVKLEPVEGTELSKVILSQRAAERLGIQTDQIRLAKPARAGNGSGPTSTRKVISHAAVLYDENGDTWTFTSPEPLTSCDSRSPSTTSPGAAWCSWTGRPPAPRS